MYSVQLRDLNGEDAADDLTGDLVKLQDMRGDLIELERDLFGDFNDSVGEITGDLYTVNSDFRGFFDLETKECAEFCNF